MADVELSARTIVEFIDAILDLYQWLGAKVPWIDRGASFRPDERTPQFVAELGLAERLSVLKEILDFESDVYTGAYFPDLPGELGRDIRATVKALRWLVKEDLEWDLASLDLVELNREAAQREGELDRAPQWSFPCEWAEDPEAKADALWYGALVGDRYALIGGDTQNLMTEAANAMNGWRATAEAAAIKEEEATDNPNEARRRYCYEQWMAGTGKKAIVTGVYKCGWGKVSENTVKNWAESYSKDHPELPKWEPRRRGRKSQKKSQ